MELQDTYATVYGNTVTVNNTAGYHKNYCAYGISYCQNTYSQHYYNIHDNNVTVYNGDYAVYLMNDTSVTGDINDNTLEAITNSSTPNTGNDAIFAPTADVGINN